MGVSCTQSPTVKGRFWSLPKFPNLNLNGKPLNGDHRPCYLNTLTFSSCPLVLCLLIPSSAAIKFYFLSDAEKTACGIFNLPFIFMNINLNPCFSFPIPVQTENFL